MINIVLKNILPISFISQNGFWKQKPEVIICSNITQQDKVIFAKQWWEELGYTFSTIHTEYKGPECKKGYRKGSILITLSTNTYGLAQTFTQINTKTKEIKATRIELSYKGETMDRCIVHEIGHGLGWSHSNSKRHIMHPIYEHGGWHTDGIELQSYSYTLSLPSHSLDKNPIF